VRHFAVRTSRFPVAIAASLAETSAAITTRTHSSLRSLLRTAEGLQSRKLVFFLSNGSCRNTPAAARSGILIYTLDSRGLLTSAPDAKTAAAPDMRGAQIHMAANEINAPLEALNELAVDTGG
jgi:hypothetical protein